jgi:ankyrin repeat protein
MDEDGWALIHRAAIFGTPEDVLMLIRYGVDPYQTIGDLGWTVLHNVVYYGIFDMFLALIPYFEHMGFDIPDLRGWTLLHIAAAEGHEPIIYHLLLQGADPDAMTRPAWNVVPKMIEGKASSIAEVARAHGEEQYLKFIKILEDFNGREVWHDAEEEQSTS